MKDSDMTRLFFKNIIRYTIYLHGFVVLIYLFSPRKIKVKGSKLHYYVYSSISSGHFNTQICKCAIFDIWMWFIFPQAFLYAEFQLLQSPCKHKWFLITFIYLFKSKSPWKCDVNITTKILYYNSIEVFTSHLYRRM